MKREVLLAHWWHCSPKYLMYMRIVLGFNWEKNEAEGVNKAEWLFLIWLPVPSLWYYDPLKCENLRICLSLLSFGYVVVVTQREIIKCDIIGEKKIQ